jgi:hypothetical protein
MSIDPITDVLISLPKLGRSLSEPPSPVSLWRWHSRGVNGIRLDTVVVGGRRFTTAEAFSEFVRLTTDAANRASSCTSQVVEASVDEQE